MLLLLAAIWGGSYVLIKVAVEDVEPAPMMAIRALVAGIMLAAYLAIAMGGRRAVAEVTTNWRPVLVLGAFNAGDPVLARRLGREARRLERRGHRPVHGADLHVPPRAPASSPTSASGRAGWPASRSASSASSSSRDSIRAAAGSRSPGRWPSSSPRSRTPPPAIYGQLRVRTVAGPVLATGSMLAGGLILLPFALFQLPSEMPSAEAIASIAALTVLGTAFAQLVLFRMLRLYGSRRLSLVTYLMPGFAVVYGAVLLDEPVSAAALGGLVLILAGVALASGASLLRARAPRARSGRSARRHDDLAPSRRADDAAFLVELFTHEDVEPFLAAVRPKDIESVRSEIERSEAEPDAHRRLRGRGRRPAAPGR